MKKNFWNIWSVFFAVFSVFMIGFGICQLIIENNLWIINISIGLLGLIFHIGILIARYKRGY